MQRSLMVTSMLTLLFASATSAQRPAPQRAEGEGPFERLIIRGATLIDGTGAPPSGPVDIVDRRQPDHAASPTVGIPGLPIEPAGARRAREIIEADGMYVLPGFVDLHVHTGGVQKAPEAEYVYKLWLAHGITTVRGVPFGGSTARSSEKARSAKNEITAPRMFVVSAGRAAAGTRAPIRTPEQARASGCAGRSQQGVDGLKLVAHPPDDHGRAARRSEEARAGHRRRTWRRRASRR